MVPALCPLDAYMAFFKFRKSGGDPVAAAASPAESVEALRRRALHRLIGAAVLVLAGVIGACVARGAEAWTAAIAGAAAHVAAGRAAAAARPGGAIIAGDLIEHLRVLARPGSTL